MDWHGLLQLVAELREWKDPAAEQMAANLRPLGRGCAPIHLCGHSVTELFLDHELHKAPPTRVTFDGNVGGLVITPPATNLRTAYLGFRVPGCCCDTSGLMPGGAVDVQPPNHACPP